MAREIKINNKMRRRAFTPYIETLFYTIIMSVMVPVFLFIGAADSIAQGFIPGIPGAIIVIIVYGGLVTVKFFLPYVLPGLRLLYDLITNSFESGEVRHISSTIERTCFLPKLLLLIPLYGNTYKKRNRIEPLDFLKVNCRMGENSWETLLSAHYHGLAPGDICTVVYGKHSKVIFSILLKSGEEVRDIPLDVFLAKRNMGMKKWGRKHSDNQKTETIEKVATPNEVTVPNKEMRIKTFVSYFGSMLYMVMSYLIMPVYSFLFIIKINSKVPEDKGGILFILLYAFFVLYIEIFIPYVWPGLQILYDVMSGSYLTDKMWHESTVMNKTSYFAEEEFKFSFSSGGRTSYKKKGDFAEVYCRKEDNSRIILFSSRYHGMRLNRLYTIIYGKHSKVIVAILPEDGITIWDISENARFLRSAPDSSYQDEKWPVL